MHKVKIIWHGMYDTRDEQIRQLCFLSGVAAANIANIATAATDTKNYTQKWKTAATTLRTTVW